MKILTAEQIREIDAKTMEYHNISSTTLMLQASDAFGRHFLSRYGKHRLKVAVVCGTGNNGGDGIAAAGMFHRTGFKVKIYVVEFSNNYSDDALHYLNDAVEENIEIVKIRNSDEIPSFEDAEVIVDAIFGSGLNRPIGGLAHDVIDAVNQSGKPVVSIDVPSGMMLNQKTEFAVQATETITLQIPKLSLFLPENAHYVGKLTMVDFGLSEKAIEETETDTFYLTKEAMQSLLKPLSRFVHKGTQGHSLIIGGSLGKIGSVCLASKAALKTGCGLVTAFVPQCGTIPLQSNFPEAMVIEDRNNTHISEIAFNIDPDAIGIGTGMGVFPETAQAFLRFLKRNGKPLVIDADGLNILSKNRDWLSLLPVKTILTPHPKELSRLIGAWDNGFEMIQKTRKLAKELNITVVIKGAHTLIVSPDKLHVNSTGTPALATAGTGDVLTGMITSLLAQGYASLEAALLGVYIHGATADITAEDIHPHSFVASDIIENIGNVYFQLEEEEEEEEEY